MGSLPSGTVTLLFSDIEGSTRLLTRLGLAYADALRGQRRILRAAWTSHRGTELGTEGDSFFVAFESAADAVSAASQAQRQMAGHSWPEGEQVRVRIGIHTGAPTVLEDGYVGMDVHRCARVAGAAHGGQIVISDATADLVDGWLPDGVELLDLGSHRLRDLPAPEHLYQVLPPGLPARFPPLKSLGAVSRLPTPATPLIGRQAELSDLATLLGPGAARLVTLTGSGGSGKTRLAVELARQHVDDFPNGVHFVPLAHVNNGEQMWTAIAESVGVGPSAPTVTELLAHLTDLRTLLVLDNLEHLTAAEQVVAALLSEAPHLTVVATSRRPLHLPDEHEYPVSPLRLPPDSSPGAAQSSPAVELFVQRGRRVRRDFGLTPDNLADIVAVCRYLDGLPLALEIAAARLKVLTPHALLARLDQGLDLAATAHDVPDRQRSLRATIAWSYDLLTLELQRSFARLGVFAGGADLAAVAAVITDAGDPGQVDGLEVVTSLLDASLVTITEAPDGEPRVALLETVRAFALDRLAATGDPDEVHARHAQHYVSVIETLWPLLNDDRPWEVRDRIDVELDNLRAALRWALDPGTTSRQGVDVSQVALTLCAGLGSYWNVGGQFVEARHWLERAIARAGGTKSPELARCMQALSTVLMRVGEFGKARELASAAVDVERELGDTGWRLASALSCLAAVAGVAGESPDTIRPLYDEALDLVRGTSDSPLEHLILSDYALLEHGQHDYHRALELNDEAIALAHAYGDVTAVRLCRHNRACVLRLMGNVDEAQAEMIDIIPAELKDMSPNGLITVAEDYGAVLAELGNHHAAVQLLGAADELRERTGCVREWAQDGEVRAAYEAPRAAMSQEQWDDAYQEGRRSSLDELLRAQVCE